MGARLGKYIDWFLQPVVQETKFDLKDMKHLIQLLSDIKLESGLMHLATADVALLYTIINHQEGLQATRGALREFSDFKCRHFFLECLEYSLSHNYRIFSTTIQANTKNHYGG